MKSINQRIQKYSPSVSPVKIARDKIIKTINCDFPEDLEKASELLMQRVGIFQRHIGYISISAGAWQGSIKEIQKLNFGILYDLKFYGNAKEVEEEVYKATKLGVQIITIAPFGTINMMQGANKGRNRALNENPSLKKPLLITHTIPSGMSQGELNVELGIAGNMNEIVLRSAINAIDSNLDGIICPAQYIKVIWCCKAMIHENFIIISTDGESNAIRDGADFIIVDDSVRTTQEAEDLHAEILKAVENLEIQLTN